MMKEEEEFKITIRCSDGVCVDAKPFAKECMLIRNDYECRFFEKFKFEGQSDILYKVAEFCEGRAKINNNNPADLNAFDSQFLQRYHSDAINLMIAAFYLDIKSLKELLMKEVDDMLTKMTADEIYGIFHNNLKDYNYYKFEIMVHLLNNFPEEFE
uniref:SKP1-like protein 11 n=1 Tax=Erigeron canadensis TaxID=72917 RepID=UPI001CB8DC2A|nr:SKP1-like protein 11 [Erigeron canadensis]